MPLSESFLLAAGIGSQGTLLVSKINPARVILGRCAICRPATALFRLNFASDVLRLLPKPSNDKEDAHRHKGEHRANDKQRSTAIELYLRSESKASRYRR